MPTANELFAETSVEEPHIVIGSDRKIKIPDSLKRLGVQHDHNIETVTFDCPRYWDDHDMSKMAVYINYMLSNGYSDAYPADNIKVEGDIMHFSWTVSRNVTQVPGVVNFLVCVKNTDGAGNEVNHWNSELCQEAYISKGMEAEEMEVLAQSDLITSLLLRMDSVEKINVQASEMRDLVAQAQTAADTAIVAKNVAVDETNQIKNSFANAIKGNASGEVVRVDDVSPVEHDIEVKTHSKNLWNNLAFQSAITNDIMRISSVTASSIIITSVEGYVGNGHRPTDIKLKQACPQMKANETYVLQANSVSNIQSIYLAEAKQYWNFNQALTITEELLNCTIGLYGLSSMRDQGYGDCVISNIQIEEGTVATDYEPYIDPTTVTVTGCGKNIFDPARLIKASKNTTLNEDVFTTNFENGSLFLNGPAYANKMIIPSGLYTITFVPVSAEFNAVFIVYDAETKDMIVNTKVGTSINVYTYTFEATKACVPCLGGWGAADGGFLNEYSYKVQLEVGSTGTEYESFFGNTYTPDENGNVSVTSVSPITTVFTDTPGVTIDAEYNRDTTKMFESYVLTEEAKNEIAGLITDEILNKARETVMYEMQSELNSISDLIGGA